MTEEASPPEPARKSRTRLIAGRLGLLLVIPPIAWVVGALGGYIFGLLLAYAWSTPRQPPGEFQEIPEWSALIGSFGLAAYALATMATSGWLERRRTKIKKERSAYYVAWKEAGYEWDRIPEYKSTAETVFAKVNTWLAIAAAAICIFVFDVFEHFAGHQYLAGAAILFGLPALAYVASQSERRSHAATWAVAGAVVLLVFGARGVNTAFFHEYANCWQVATSGEWEIVDCAPGSEPVQALPGYNTWTDTETAGRECLETETDAGSASRWRCHET